MGSYCDDDELIQKLQVLEDEYGIIADEKKKWESEFAAKTNAEFKEYEADPRRIFVIAITEHALGINHRQSRISRMVQTKRKGAKGRSVSIYTDTGVRLGGGLISDKKKYNALAGYEKQRYDKGIGFQPILYETMEVDGDYMRFDDEGKQGEAEQDEAAQHEGKRG